MASYKTHSIHGELVLSKIGSNVEINIESMKTYCVGPDTIVSVDFKAFKTQHRNKTRVFFETLIEQIKKNEMQYNSEVMAFLYGQIDHFILDVTIHPLIRQISSKTKYNKKLSNHSLIEHEIDNYISHRYKRRKVFYYHKLFIKNRNLKKLICDIYKTVYGVQHAHLKYTIGSLLFIGYDAFVRRIFSSVTKLICKIMNIGNIIYTKNSEWPFEEFKDDFENVWEESIEKSCDTIAKINNYLYSDCDLDMGILKENLAYNTGRPCKE